MAQRTCSIDGCEAASFCRSWCTKHYARWWRLGDPLALMGGGRAMVTFRRLVALETDECVVWPHAKNQKGYGRVTAPDKRRNTVHALACEAEHGPRPLGMEAAHLCGNTSCMNRRHLQWATHAENEKHKARHGTSRGRKS